MTTPSKNIGISILIFACCFFATSWAFASHHNPSLGPLVEVDHYPYVKTSNPDHPYKLLPYVVRRGSFGVYFDAGASSYRPKLVQNNLDTQGNTATYHSSQANLFGGGISPKYNSPVGSISLDLAMDGYQLPSTTGGGIKATVYQLGMTWTIDTIFSEPYVAPYFSGGLYKVSYNDVTANGTNSHTDAPAPYVAVGALFQLDWMDPTSSFNLNEHTGIQSTYLFFEARNWMRGSTNDPDFSSPLALSAGLKFEF